MDESIGAKSTVCGGGRYNGLVKEIGGPDQPGIGFGLGLERLMLALKAKGIELPYPKGIDFYVIALGEDPKHMRVKILQMLRAVGFRAETDYMDRKMKAQLKAADRLGARYALILGDEELNQGIVQVKNLANGEQQEVMIDHLIENCKELMKKNWEM
jgi:histidyl-tRNA synthetase